MSYGSQNQILSSVNGTSIGGFRNRVINGDMRIDQANAGTLVSIGTSIGYGPDMWIGGGTVSAGVYSIQQSSSTPSVGFTNFLRFTTTTADASPAAGSFYFLEQMIEGFNCQDLLFGTNSAKTITISFMVRSSLNGIFSGAIANGGFNRSFPFTFVINSTNTWEYKTITIQGDFSGTWATDNTVGLRLYIDMGTGANGRQAAGTWYSAIPVGVTGAVRVISTLNATFDLTGVQLEPGPIATVFEYRDRATELIRCQRYYQKSFTQNTVPAQNVGLNTGTSYGIAAVAGVVNDYIFIYFPVIMRASPTITLYNPSNTNGQVRDQTAGADCSSTITFGNIDRSFSIQTNGAVTTIAGSLLTIHWVADARL